MSVATVPSTGVIYAGLFSRGKDSSGTFHWSIMVPSDDGTTATIFHANNPRAAGGAWRYSCWVHRTIYESKNICVFFSLKGTVTETHTLDHIDELLRAIPLEIPPVDQDKEDKSSCRVWFKQAVRVLTANGIINCSDVEALEREAKKLAKEQYKETIMGNGFKIYPSISL